jgi:hypothetical protein
MKQFLEYLNFPLDFAHELFHYIPAKLMGLNPTLKQKTTARDDGGQVKNLIVILTPLAVGLLGLVITLLLKEQFASVRLYRFIWLGILIFWIRWVMLSAIDVYNASFILCVKHWAAERIDDWIPHKLRSTRS